MELILTGFSCFPHVSVKPGPSEVRLLNFLAIILLTKHLKPHFQTPLPEACGGGAGEQLLGFGSGLPLQAT